MLYFITGGACSGKSVAAKNIERELLKSEVCPSVTVADDYSKKIRELLCEGRDAAALTEMMLSGYQGDDKLLIIVCDELGCGLVPIDEFERRYREINGRIACTLAQKADRVYRMISGLAQRIK